MMPQRKLKSAWSENRICGNIVFLKKVVLGGLGAKKPVVFA